MSGADEAAAAAFTSAFRKQAVLGDQNHPAWVRVNPVAEKVGLSGRWTLPGQVLAFPGMTPAALEQQGLRWWKEAPAKALILTNAEGEDVALAEMRGRPVVVQYFVGVHCGFCLSALGALADKMPAFDEAGVAVLAVSPDKSADLKAFVQSSEPGKWPFPLLADPSGRAMKACGIWDDFADEPMHGTVLMDADGKILWSFSGHEPFKAWDLLLSELRRPGVLKADRR